MNKIDYVVTSTTKYIEQMTKAQRKNTDNSLQVKKLLCSWQNYLTYNLPLELFRFLILVLALVFFRLH